MTSQIDATKPPQGSAATADVRANEAATEAEINKLKGEVTDYEFTATAAANAITFTLLNESGLTPDATEGVALRFRSNVGTSASRNVRTVAAALAVTLPQGATLGFAASEVGVVYLYALDNAGTVELAVSGTPSINTTNLQSTTLLNSNSDDGATIYSAVARTDVPVKLIGRITVQHGSTLGDWANSPTAVGVIIGEPIVDLTPSGVIVMWSGSVATIPSGYALCDGSGSTPDLRDKFVIGAGSTYNPDDTGGSDSHTHTDTFSVADHTLTISQIPSHNHPGTYNSAGGSLDNVRAGTRLAEFQSAQNPTTSTANVTAQGGGGGHNHGLNGTVTSATTLPPYYALAYIMKV